MFLQQGRTSKCSENKAQSVHPLWYMTLGANYIMKRDKDIYIYRKTHNNEHNQSGSDKRLTPGLLTAY